MCISRTTTSKTAATFKPSAHLWRLELRVSPIIRIKPAESLYGGHAMAKVFLEIPRGTPANTKAFPTRLAGLPQTPKYFPRDLREYPQTPKHIPWDLRDSRKRQGISRETCGSTRKRQSISRGTCGTSAGQKHFGRLQRAIKDILLGLGSPFFHRTHVVYEITHFLLAIAKYV